MGASSGNGQRGMITGINVTPLVDVMLVLLIIFMVTATYIVRGSIGMKLPKAASAEGMPKTPLVLAVDKDGDYIISGRKATLPEVEQWIAQRVADDPEVEAVISGDERVQYGKVMGLINLARVHGVKNFAAAVERKAQR